MDVSSRSEPDPTATNYLLELALTGDAAAEHRLLTLYRQPLEKYARSRLAALGLAERVAPEDLVSEAYVRWIEKRLLRGFEIRGRGALLKRLYRVVENVALDVMKHERAEKRGGRIEMRSLDETQWHAEPRHVGIPSREPTPTSNARVAEFHAKAKEVLNEREWRVWVLHVLREDKSPAIADEMGLSPSTVRGLLQQAKRKLIGLFEP